MDCDGLNVLLNWSRIIALHRLPVLMAKYFEGQKNLMD